MRTDGRDAENRPIDTARLENGVEGTLFSGRIEHHETIDSTNTRAKALADAGAPEGTVVIAEQQRAGRGRMKRKWLSPARTNLLFSVVLRPGCRTDGIFAHTMLLALAAMDALEETEGIRAMIKWPNDLYVGERKLGGILSELAMDGPMVAHMVVGLGLNVNWKPGAGEEILYPATSILSETGKKICRTDLLVHILRRLDRMYTRFSASGDPGLFYRRWNERCMVLGRRVRIVKKSGTRSGKAVRIDADGALVLLNDSGREERIVAGDVSLRF